MKLFESSWVSDFKYYERVFNTETNKSEIYPIDGRYEYYEPDSHGIYKCINENITLRKSAGRSKDTHGKYGVYRPIYRNIKDKYWQNKQYNENPDVLYLDIETRARVAPDPENATQEIILIQMFDKHKNTMFVLGLRDWKEEPDYTFEYQVKYIKCKDETELLINFGKLFRALNPLIIYAWNGNGFDFPYLYNRAKKLGIYPDDILCATGQQVTLNKRAEQKGQVKYDLISPSHYFIDMMDVYKSVIKAPRKSYSLDNISKIELHDNKVEHTEFLSFDGFYTGKDYQISDTPYDDRVREEIRQLQIRKQNGENVDFELLDRINFQFVYYGIYDVFLIKRLDEKLNFTKIQVSVAATMGVLVSEGLKTILPWEMYIANTALKNNIVMPPAKEHSDPHIVGAYVRTPQVGKQRWVMNFDVNSMYPLLAIVAFNMSPETYVPIYQLPSDLKDLVLAYFNDQDDDARFNLKPEIWETLSVLLKKYNLSMAPNGACFKHDFVGIVPKLVLEIYKRRKQEKKTMLKYEQRKVDLKDLLEHNQFGEVNSVSDILECDIRTLSKNAVINYIRYCEDQQQKYDVLQHTDKIMINSLYGAHGNKHFILFNEHIAQAITICGRYFIKKTANYIEEKLQKLIPSDKLYAIGGDTDSFYYHIEPFVKRWQSKNTSELTPTIDFCDMFAEKVIQPIIQESIDDFATEFNIFNKDVVGAKRESISDVSIWVAKKCYLMRVRDSEGTRYPLEHPKIKIMGLQLIKSSTPKFTQDKIMKAIDILLDGDERELNRYLEECEKQFRDAPLGEIAGITSVSSLDYDLFGKIPVPIQSRSAILYNEYIKNNNLLSKYNPILPGEKIKRLYLKSPNQFMKYKGKIVNSDSVAFLQDEFAEAELRKVVDYDMNYEKFFLRPLFIITDALKYNLSGTSVLEDW